MNTATTLPHSAVAADDDAENRGDANGAHLPSGNSPNAQKDCAVPVFFYTPMSKRPEPWLAVHTRRLFVHTVHHNVLSVGRDGRVAIASGPHVTLMHLPPFTPFRPILNPPMRRIYSEDACRVPRKDTLSTNTHFTAINWAGGHVVGLSGVTTLLVLRPSPTPDTTDISPNSDSRLWLHRQFVLPHQQDNPPYRESVIRCVAHTRLRAPTTGQIAEDLCTYHPVIVYGTNNSANLIPLPSNDDEQQVSLPPLEIHPTCTTCIACIEGVTFNGTISTVIALADVTRAVFVYKVSLHNIGKKMAYSVQMVYRSEGIPVSPITSLTWSMHSSRSSFITLAIGLGNNVVVMDWISSAIASDSETWSRPQIHCILDAHEQVVTSVEICHDGCIVSCCMDGRISCWRINPLLADQDSSSSHFEISAAIIQEGTEGIEPVLNLERSTNAFGVISVTSTSRLNHDPLEADEIRKFSCAARRTLIQVHVVPPFGSAEQVETAIFSCLDRLLTHPTHFDQPLTFWDVAHFIYSISEVSAEIVPQLNARLAELVDELENGAETSTQRYMHKCRVILWLARVISHPDGTDLHDRKSVADLSKRIRNSLLFVYYNATIQKYLSVSNEAVRLSELEYRALDNMCYFLSTWNVRGYALAEPIEGTVAAVRAHIDKFFNGPDLASKCVVCKQTGVDNAVNVDAEDPGTFRCSVGHMWERCVLSGMPSDEVVSLECTACAASAYHLPEDLFKWIVHRDVCVLCRGGLVSGHLAES